MSYMDINDDIEETIRKTIDELLGDNVKFDYKYKGKNSICSTCKHFNGESCTKRISFAGFADKLSDCNEWEVCN